MRTTASGTRDHAPTSPTLPTSYTPGPWRVHSHRQIGPDAGVVCEVWSAIGANHADRIAAADANARLIAGAPEMHQALAAVLADYRADLALVRPSVMNMIRAALANAEGGAA